MGCCQWVAVGAGATLFVGVDSSKASTESSGERSTMRVLFLPCLVRRTELFCCLDLWARCVALQSASRRGRESVLGSNTKFHSPACQTRASETPSRRSQCQDCSRQYLFASVLTWALPDSQPSDLAEVTAHQRLQRESKARRRRICGLLDSATTVIQQQHHLCPRKSFSTTAGAPQIQIPRRRTHPSQT
jgi:hypothetical protein